MQTNVKYYLCAIRTHNAKHKTTFSITNKPAILSRKCAKYCFYHRSLLLINKRNTTFDMLEMWKYSQDSGGKTGIKDFVM